MQHNVSLPAWSDAPELVKDGVLHVSIHVPAWGATHRQSWLPVLGNVSIHAPAWGATKQNFSRIISLGVSIHAPAWGATRTTQRGQGLHCDFNPRSRVGSDYAYLWHLGFSGYFNPRSRVGSDDQFLLDFSDIISFNPRSRVGSDLRHDGHAEIVKRFNPRSRVGSDLSVFVGEVIGVVSIHAPAWGATVPGASV